MKRFRLWFKDWKLIGLGLLLGSSLTYGARNLITDTLQLRPGTLPSTATSRNGQLAVDSADNKLKKFNETGSVWEEISGSGAAAANDPSQLENLGISTSVAASALTVNLKQADGSTDPASGTGAVNVSFQQSDGSYDIVSVTSSLSMTVSSGSDLGHSSGIEEYIYVYLLDNSGTAELAVSSILFDEGSTQSTTAEGGAGGADSRTVLYSTTARSNVPIRLIARLESNQATAGTWNTGMSEESVATFELDNVNTPLSGGLNMCAGVVDMPGTPATIRDTNCIASYIDHSAGQVTVNFDSGTFASSPYCTCSGAENSDDNCMVQESNVTSTSARFFITSSAGALRDADFHFNCVGPN